MDIENLWVLKIYLYSNFAGLNFVGTQKNCGNSNLLVFILKNLLKSKFGALSFVGTQKNCGYTEFVMIQKSR